MYRVKLKPQENIVYALVISFNSIITYIVICLYIAKLYLLTNPGFEYDTTPSFPINFQCTDSNLENSTIHTLTVNIQPNNPPSITGLPTSVSINDGEDGPKKIYDISVSDVENNAFACHLTPAGTPFNYQSTPGRQSAKSSHICIVQQ